MLIPRSVTIMVATSLVVGLLTLAGCAAPAAAPTPTKPAAAPAPAATKAPEAAPAATKVPEATKPAAVAAPKYPTKAIEIVVGYAAGGGQDTVARLVAAYAQDKWKVPVTVTNKPGGGGWVGASAAFAATPDGYTMLGNGPTSYYSLAVAKNPPFKITDGTPVARVVINPLVFAVKGDAKWNSLKEFVDEAKKAPESFRGSGSGLAGLTAFAGAKVWIAAGVDPSKFPIVVFDSGVLSNQAVAAGNAEYSVNNLVEGLSLWEAKKLKFLAVTTPQRSPQAPDVPTGKEAGFPDFDTLGFAGLWGPTGLPDYVVAAWDSLIKEANQDPKFIEQAGKAGMMPGYLGPKEFKDYLYSTFDWAADLGKKLKIEL